jgi:SPP1 family predicted phage head-tail adaptor
MRIGQMTERLLIQRQTKTPDAIGGHVSSWIPDVSVWAHVRRVSGQKLVSYGQTLSTLAYEVTIRVSRNYSAQGDFAIDDFNDPDFYTALDNDTATDNSWRIVYRGRYLNIKSVEEEDNRTFYRIFATEGL